MADNQKMILNLFAGVQGALFLGDRFSSGEFVSFLQPGQFISTDLQENANSEAMAIQSEIANIVVDSSYVNKYQNVDYSGGTELSGSVDGIYGFIMDSAALPKGGLTPGQEREIEQLLEWLSNNLANYTRYQDFYLSAQNAYDTERFSQHPNPATLRQLRQKMTQAKDNFDTFGKSGEHENKVKRIRILSRPNPSAMFDDYREKFENQKQISHITQTEYLQTFLTPPVSSWNSPGTSWATYEKKISETDSYEYSKATSWSSGLSGRWGLWSWGGGTSGSSEYKHEHSEATTVDLKFDYLRVRIRRPWLDQNVFGHRFWTWKRDFGCSRRVSNGGNLAVNPPERPVGMMPVLINYLIVVRNLELSSTFTETDKTFWRRQTQSNASIGWGPFSLSGSYKEEQQSRRVQASFDSTTFRINHPQIIARTGRLMELCPNPEAGLAWEEDACPVRAFQPTEEELRLMELDYQSTLFNELLSGAREEALRIGEEHYARMQREIEDRIFSTKTEGDETSETKQEE